MISGKNETIQTAGFAMLPEIIAYHEIDSLKVELASTSVKRSRAGARHLLRDSTIANLAEDPRLLDIANQVLCSEARPFRATLFDKSLASNWLVVWHQDTALPLRERVESPGWGPWSVKEGLIYAHAPATALEQIVALRIHLDDSTEKNGPLRVLPGTHTLGVLTDNEIKQLVSEIPAVDCLGARGGIIAMRPLIVHASSKSLIETPRRVLHIEYVSSIGIAESLELALA